jgi:hypothetical protein
MCVWYVELKGKLQLVSKCSGIVISATSASGFNQVTEKEKTMFRKFYKTYYFCNMMRLNCKYIIVKQRSTENDKNCNVSCVMWEEYSQNFLPIYIVTTLTAWRALDLTVCPVVPYTCVATGTCVEQLPSNINAAR